MKKIFLLVSSLVSSPLFLWSIGTVSPCYTPLKYHGIGSHLMGSHLMGSHSVCSDIILYQPNKHVRSPERSQKIPAIVMLIMFITVILVSEIRHQMSRHQMSRH